jgi:hypothetical protein
MGLNLQALVPLDLLENQHIMRAWKGLHNQGVLEDVGLLSKRRLRPVESPYQDSFKAMMVQLHM